MNIQRRHFMGAALSGAAALAAPRVFAAPVSGPAPALLDRARAALDAHGDSILHRDMIGIVDFAAPSRAARFQFVDIAGGRVLETLLVAHGSGSDPANRGWVERFSNREGSNASSPGAYVTGLTYVGKHGRSRRLRGLDPENSLAAQRSIVIHGASYVSTSLAETTGRIGRSQGCFAVSQADVAHVLAKLGEGRLLYAGK